jgi:peptidoglycan hydrolase CwlO-like protein
MCDSLTGPNGGYILLDHDIKFGVVCEKLDNISDKLDMIRKQQRELYYAIERCQRSIDDLGNSIDNLTDRMEKHNNKIDDALQNIDYNINVGNEYNRISANYAMHRYIWDR